VDETLAAVVARGGGMKRVDRYIGVSVISATLLAWLVIVGLEALFVLLGQFADVGRGDYGFGDALLFVALGVPTRAWQAFPMAVLIGVVLGLGNLAAQFELDAFRLAGCSPRRLTRAVLQAGAVMLAVAMLAGEWAAPHSRHLAGQLRSQAIYAGGGVQPGAGFWVHEGQRFIRVGRSAADGELVGVVIYELAPGPRLRQVTAAQTATPVDGDWLLEQVAVLRFEAERIALTQVPEQELRGVIDTRMARLLTRDADSLALPELAEYIDYLRRNGSDTAAYRLNYWQRVAAPLSVLAMLLLAVALVLGPVGKRAPGQRLLVAVLAGLLFKLLGSVIAHAGLVYGMPPVLGAVMPSLVVLAGIALIAYRPAAGLRSIGRSG
jgi:lipopolysaccharide export system permease protein